MNQDECNKENGKEFLLTYINREIRTPLNGMTGYLYLMRESLNDKEKLEEYMEQMEMSMQYLGNILNDIEDSAVQEKCDEEKCSGKTLETMSGKRIILADKHIISREVIGSHLERNGVQVLRLSSAAEALETFRESPEGTIHCVILKHQMSGTEVSQTAKAIRQLRRTDADSVILIALTNAILPEERDKLIQSGINEVMIKPLDINSLGDMLKGVI